jgi:hypothetical protein
MPTCNERFCIMRGVVHLTVLRTFRSLSLIRIFVKTRSHAKLPNLYVQTGSSVLDNEVENVKLNEI